MWIGCQRDACEGRRDGFQRRNARRKSQPVEQKACIRLIQPVEVEGVACIPSASRAVGEGAGIRVDTCCRRDKHFQRGRFGRCGAFDLGRLG